LGSSDPESNALPSSAAFIGCDLVPSTAEARIFSHSALAPGDRDSRSLSSSSYPGPNALCIAAFVRVAFSLSDGTSFATRSRMAILAVQNPSVRPTVSSLSDFFRAAMARAISS